MHKHAIKHTIKQSFNRVAGLYTQHAFIQNKIADRLAARVRFLNRDFKHILDAGCGTGVLTNTLREYFPKSEMMGLDLAYQMLQYSEKPNKNKKKFFFSGPKPIHWINADLECLPFRDNQFDLVVSNLSLHWCNLDQVMENIQRVLKPGGILLFTVPGPDTLLELSTSFKQIDGHDHVNGFLDMHEYGDCLLKHKFKDVVMDVERLVINYPSVESILKELKYTGVRNLHPNRRNGVLTPRLLSDLKSHYPSVSHQYPLTFELVYGYGICPEKKSVFNRIPTQIANVN